MAEATLPMHDSQDVADVYAALEVQRRQTIKQYWRTSFQCVLWTPVAIMPLALFFTLMAEHPWTEALPVVAAFLKGIVQTHGSPVVLGALIWTFVGLFFVGRHFRNNAQRPKWDYVRNYKTKLYTHLCAEHFPGLAYDFDGYIGWDEFEATGLFTHEPDWYRSEDYFSGRIGATDVYFCEAHAKRERRDWTSKNNRKYYETYFQGLVFVADFHKHFHCTTRLIPQGEKVERVRGEKEVVFEDPEFNERFTTTSTDQTDVRYILSSSMLQRFVQLTRRFPRLRARFHGEKLMLMLPTGRDMFEPSLYRTANSPAQINRLVQDINMVMPIVDELNLNTRIWSKV